MPNFGSDNWIDAQLRNVPVPPDLLSRLAGTGAASEPNGADARLDAVLRNVSVPPYLEARLLRIARRRPRPLWRRFGLAASIFLVLGLSTAGYVGLITGVLVPGEPMFVTQATPAATGHELSSVPAVTSQQRRVVPLAASATEAVTTKPASGAVAAAGPASDQTPAADADQGADFGTMLTQAVETHRRSQAALGAAGDFKQLPALDAWDGLQVHGVAPPIVRGYDLLFQLKHGEHPFVSPAAHPTLLTSTVPLTFRTTSYDLALRALAGGTMPSADEIRVEDFLAAQNLALPPAPVDDVTLHAAASPSPVGGAGLYLVQLTVQAGPRAVHEHPPTRLIVVVDTSAAMLSGARWEAVLRGLAKTAAHMGSADRVTLLGFSEQSRVLAENCTQAQLRQLLASGSLATPAGSADLAAAIRASAEAVQSVASSEARRVVFITSGRADLDDRAIKISGETLARMAGAKVPWQIVRVGASQDDPQWTVLAERGRGEISKVSSSAELHDALTRNLTGDFATVAGGATLKLRFDPELVTSYRLLGHEMATVTGASDRLEIDLPANETATGLFEIRIKGKGDQLAVAELSWRDPASGQPHGTVQPIWRSHFAPSFAKAPAWFQQGVFAAKVAEALRGSFYLSGTRPWATIEELAGQVDAEAADRPEFQALMRLVKQAEKRR